MRKCPEIQHLDDLMRAANNMCIEHASLVRRYGIVVDALKYYADYETYLMSVYTNSAQRLERYPRIDKGRKAREALKKVGEKLPNNDENG